MTRDEELRKESDFCRKSAEGARDPSYRRALIELADWWEWQADLARPAILNNSLTRTLGVGSSLKPSDRGQYFAGSEAD